MPSDTPSLVAAFEEQIGWCQRLGSPFTAALLRWLLDDWRAGGPLRTLLPDWPGDARADLVPLRLAGGLHALALARRPAALATLYPPAARAFDAAALAPLLRAALTDDAAHLRDFLAHAPQTNEVQRSAVLIAGYAAIGQETGLPLALHEIGASAGLNLLWDRIGYRLGAQRWGDAHSPVQLVSDWRGAPPALPGRIDVVERHGNDLAPIDLHDPDAALRLRAYVWPDQAARAERLNGAIALAQQNPPALQAGDAADWVEQHVAPRPGVATLLVHSVVWQYLPAATRERIAAALARAGAHASRAAPLAWLSMEFHASGAPAELRLTLWPGGATRTLAHAHPHGEWVEFL